MRTSGHLCRHGDRCDRWTCKFIVFCHIYLVLSSICIIFATENKVKRMKYPIGIQDFAQIIQDGYVYVDKTDLVYKGTQKDRAQGGGAH